MSNQTKRSGVAGVLALSMAAAALFSAADAIACSCAFTNQTPEQIVAEGEVIALGEVRGVSMGRADLVVYEFAVKHAVNADLSPVIEVMTSASSAACGAPLGEVGGPDVVVWLSGSAAKGYRVNLCTQAAISQQESAWRTLLKAGSN
ncbi:MAG: hypothetical protein KTR21_12685 [Rhodobacteraceae bacterium]|nr:hypothetical protein [Paracoccaceae bacterium]